MCKINHNEVDALPCVLCRACRPELNRPVTIATSPKTRRKEKWRQERMILTVKEEAERRWRQWLPTMEDRKRPRRKTFERIVREERGMA